MRRRAVEWGGEWATVNALLQWRLPMALDANCGEQRYDASQKSQSANTLQLIVTSLPDIQFQMSTRKKTQAIQQKRKSPVCNMTARQGHYL